MTYFIPCGCFPLSVSDLLPGDIMQEKNYKSFLKIQCNHFSMEQLCDICSNLFFAFCNYGLIQYAWMNFSTATFLLNISVIYFTQYSRFPLSVSDCRLETWKFKILVGSARPAFGKQWRARPPFTLDDGLFVESIWRVSYCCFVGWSVTI
jgi:hypothetical protein